MHPVAAANAVISCATLQCKALSASALLYLAHLARASSSELTDEFYTLIMRALLPCPDGADAWHVQAAVAGDMVLASKLHVSPDSCMLPVISRGETFMCTRQDAEGLPGATLFGAPLDARAEDAPELPTMDSNFCFYESDELVGYGQTAKVFSATDALGIPYAIKQLEMSRLAVSVSNPLELDIARRLHHPHLLHCVRVITPSSCKHVRSPAMVTGLYSRLDAVAPLETLGQVARGLEFLHRNELVHGDIKPDNFLRSGDRGLLADFGSATYAHSGVTDHRGTRYYMAPELFTDQPRPTAKSDVWAYAASVVDMMLEGSGSLFSLDNFEQDYAKFVSDPFTRLYELLPPDLATLFAPCFALEPELRPSMSQLLAAMQARPCVALVSSPPLHPAPASAVRDLLALCDAYPQQPAAVAFAAVDLLYAYWEQVPNVHALFWIAASLVGNRAALGGVQAFLKKHSLRGNEFLEAQYRLIEASDAGLLRSPSLLSLAESGSDLAYGFKDVLSRLPETPDVYLSLVPETFLAQARALPRLTEAGKGCPYSLVKEFVATL